MRITVYVDHVDDDSDFLFVKNWIKKWGDAIHIQDYSAGKWEHIWDFEAPVEAVKPAFSACRTSGAIVRREPTRFKPERTQGRLH